MNRLIRFHAEWCGPCKMSEGAWNQFMKDHSKEFVFESIDVDKDPGRASDFQVSGVPTIIVEHDDGSMLRHVGSFNIKTLERLSLGDR